MAEENVVKGEGGAALIIKLLVGIAIGIVIGRVCAEWYRGPAVMQVVGSIQYFCGQIIFYAVPLVVLAFIGPSIIRLGSSASKMLFVGVGLAYLSSVGAALFAYAGGTLLFPYLKIETKVEETLAMPDLLFQFAIPPLMGVLTALVTALIFGLAILWSKSKTLETIWYEFEQCVLKIIQKIVIPLLPVFIAATFCVLSYKGELTVQLPIFGKIIVIAIVGHFIWMFVLYALAGLISGRNPWQVAKYYGPAYLTAVGTMSSAATLPVSLACARKSPVLSRDVVDFMVPLGATVHLCGSVLTETLFVMVISHILYGSVPEFHTMIQFIFVFGFFAVGAPGVPGGTVMASLAIVTGILGFDEAGTALLIAIFALQDSFGTACNVTSDGALALMIEGIFKKKESGATETPSS